MTKLGIDQRVSIVVTRYHMEQKENMDLVDVPKFRVDFMTGMIPDHIAYIVNGK